MTTEPTAVRASTEDWCERSDDGHAWSHTFHAGAPRVETRTCMLCQFLSVEPVRELLRAAPAGTGSPTPADDLDAIEEAQQAQHARWLSSQIGELIHGLAKRDVDPAKYHGRPSALALAEIDRARAERDSQQRLAIKAGLELSQVQRERDAVRDEIGNQQRTFELMLAEVRKERDEARGRLSEETVTLQAVVNHRDEARSALAALRAEREREHEEYERVIATAARDCAALQGQLWQVGRLADEMDAVGVALDDMTIWAARLRALVTDQSPAAPAVDVITEAKNEAYRSCAEEIAGVLDVEIPADLPPDGEGWDWLITHLREVLREAEQWTAERDETREQLTNAMAALDALPTSTGDFMDLIKPLAVLGPKTGPDSTTRRLAEDVAYRALVLGQRQAAAVVETLPDGETCTCGRL